MGIYKKYTIIPTIAPLLVDWWCCFHRYPLRILYFDKSDPSNWNISKYFSVKCAWFHFHNGLIHFSIAYEILRIDSVSAILYNGIVKRFQFERDLVRNCVENCRAWINIMYRIGISEMIYFKRLIFVKASSLYFSQWKQKFLENLVDLSPSDALILTSCYDGNSNLPKKFLGT